MGFTEGLRLGAIDGESEGEIVAGDKEGNLGVDSIVVKDSCCVDGVTVCLSVDGPCIVGAFDRVIVEDEDSVIFMFGSVGISI